MDDQKPRSTNITWHPATLSPEEREEKLGQKGVVVWFTGLSGSGKSTIAREVEAALVRERRHAFVLDGDNVRYGLNKDLDFSPAHRSENIRRIAEVAKLLQQANVICLTAFVSPYRQDRDRVRAQLPAGRFVEVYCAATVEECEARDPKGLYAKARQGEISDFTGISAPYEAPEHPELVLQTGGGELVTTSVARVLEYLRTSRLL
jgi:adenylylsulfate kinase